MLISNENENIQYHIQKETNEEPERTWERIPWEKMKRHLHVLASTKINKSRSKKTQGASVENLKPHSNP
jgi:hypothetical protein